MRKTIIYIPAIGNVRWIKMANGTVIVTAAGLLATECCEKTEEKKET